MSGLVLAWFAPALTGALVAAVVAVAAGGAAPHPDRGRGGDGLPTPRARSPKTGRPSGFAGPGAVPAAPTGSA